MYLLLTAVLALILFFCVIYPLWLFATLASQLYTFLALLLIIAAIIFLETRRILRQYRSMTDGKSRRNFCLRLIFRILIILYLIVAFFFFVFFVLRENRIMAFIILAAGIALSVVLGRIRKRYSDV